MAPERTPPPPPGIENYGGEGCHSGVVGGAGLVLGGRLLGFDVGGVCAPTFGGHHRQKSGSFSGPGLRGHSVSTQLALMAGSVFRPRHPGSYSDPVFGLLWPRISESQSLQKIIRKDICF